MSALISAFISHQIWLQRNATSEVNAMRPFIEQMRKEVKQAVLAFGDESRTRARLNKLLKDLTVTVKDFRPIDEAIVTGGGVCISEINPKTMESKLIKGLYFAGEVIDADAYTGGFNLQIAFSTGHAAGMAM